MRDLSLAISTISLKRGKSSASVHRLNMAILASTVILGLVYLFTISTLATKGYEIKKLEQQLHVLEVEQKSLQLQASDLQSINHIQAEVQRLNFVPVASITYLKDSDFALK